MDDLLTQVYSVLATTPARWLKLTETLPVGLLSLAPAAGQWSAVECLQHIVDTERVFETRLASLLACRDFPGFNPDHEGSPAGSEVSPVGLAHELARRRNANLAALGRVAPDDLGRQARHQELGLVTLREMVNEWAAHDLNHTIQGERALMQPFIAGCGPWAPFFADHAARP
jgi:hypothetical protein